MKYAKDSQRMTWQHIALIVLCFVLALVLFALIFGTAYVHHLLGLITDNGDGYLNATLSSQDLATFGKDEDNLPNTHPSVDHQDVTQATLPSKPVEQLKTEGIINIMLIGEDRRPYETKRQRSDSMILCSINTNKNTITLISFLRDTYISTIPGYWPEKLNAAYALGGTNTLNQTLAAYYGIHVDGSVVVDFNGFTKIIDMLGGVDIELTKAEANHLNSPKYADVYGHDIQTVYAGMNHLDGKTALAYSRIRKLDWDVKRTERQRKVLTALVNAYKNKSVTEMGILASDILSTGFIKTDMSSDEILNYVKSLFPMLASATINSQQIPANGTFESMNVGSVTDCKVADLEANRQILKNILQ